MSDFTTNLVSHWKLDENDGTRADIHGVGAANNPLTIVNGTSIPSRDTLFGGAAYINNATPQLGITDANQTGLNPVNGKIAWSYWVNMDTFGTVANFDVHIAKFSFNASGFRSYNNTNGQITVAAGLSTSATDTVTTAGSLTLNEDNHVFIGINGSAVQIAINGVLETFTFTGTLVPISTSEVSIGDDAGNFRMGGSIQNISWWTDRVFTAAEISGLWNDSDGLIYEEYPDSVDLYPHPVRLDSGVHTRGASSVRKIKK